MFQPVSPINPFGREYFQSHCGAFPYERNDHWLSFFGGIADEILRTLHPSTVFDAGCAWGFLVEALVDRGVDARGCDISSYAISRVRPDLAARCMMGSLTAPIQWGPYDLVTCIEVVEHIPAEQALEAIRQLCKVTGCILFSSTPDDVTEETHVNVHPPLYWLAAFGEQGFQPDLLFDASFVAPHAMLLRRRKERMADEVVQLYVQTIQNRMYRAAFLQRHERLAALEKETQRLEVDLERSAAELNAASQQSVDTQLELQVAEENLATAKGKYESLEQALDSFSAEDVKLRVRLEAVQQSLTEANDKLTASQKDGKSLRAKLQSAQSESKRQDASLAQSEKIRSELNRKLEDEKLQAERLRFTLGEWEAHGNDLSAGIEKVVLERDAYQQQLTTICSSPGWRFILRYRNWLNAGSRSSPFIKRLWAPSAFWLLRKLGLAGMGEPTVILAENPAPAALPLPEPVRAPVADSIQVVAAPPVRAPAVIPVPPSDYATWIRENEPVGTALALQKQISSRFTHRPTISVVVPVHQTPVSVLREMIDSVAAQTYDRWELCISFAESDDPQLVQCLREYARREPRIRLEALAKNAGISGNSNHALALATGEYLALLDHDDLLAPFALFEVVQLINQDRTANFIYSDKDQIASNSHERVMPLFKPAWSPELMWNANYLTHLCVMRTEHVRAVGGWREETDGAQDWDLFLRVIRRFGEVRHIPKVLYHWRQISTSVASGGLEAKPYAAKAQELTVQQHVHELGLRDVVVRHTGGDLRLEWPEVGKVSIIYMSASPCAETVARAEALAKKTKYADFEIIVAIAGNFACQAPVRCVKTSASGTLLERIRQATDAASGEILVFVDETVDAGAPDWLREITGPLQVKEVGAVGARLVDPRTGLLTHCGLVAGSDGKVEPIYARYPEHVFEQFGASSWYRNWTAVSGACFAIRRDTWKTIGGVPDKLLHPRLDVHWCLKLRLEHEARVVYNPYARMMQTGESAIESALWSPAAQGAEFLRSCFPEGDPYFNPNLECLNGRVSHLRRKTRATAGTDYGIESRILTGIFDSTAAEIERSRSITATAGSGRMESITWFLPDFTNPFYGGIHTLLRFADGFLRKHQVSSHFCILGRAPESRIRRQIAAAFPALGEKSAIAMCDDLKDVNVLPRTDAAVCSLWTTAYALLPFANTRRKFYFMQDDEALFYPAGSTSALVEASYEFGFHGICNTPSLLRRYTERGGDGVSFTPSIDRAVFHHQNRKEPGGKPHVLFCYGRPNHPRNCFELLAATLQLLKQRMKDNLLIVSAGDQWDPAAYGLEGIVFNLGLLNYQATGALYRACDAGIVLMMTRHPSYLPLELMGCGTLVITNRNPDTAWLLKDGENCLLGLPTPSSLADRVEEGLRNTSLQAKVTARALEMVEHGYGDWERPIEEIYQYMVSKC